MTLRAKANCSFVFIVLTFLFGIPVTTRLSKTGVRDKYGREFTPHPSPFRLFVNAVFAPSVPAVSTREGLLVEGSRNFRPFFNGNVIGGF